MVQWALRSSLGSGTASSRRQIEGFLVGEPFVMGQERPPQSGLERMQLLLNMSRWASGRSWLLEGEREGLGFEMENECEREIGLGFGQAMRWMESLGLGLGMDENESQTCRWTLYAMIK